MKKLSENKKGELINVLKDRFYKNIDRHKNIKWEDVYDKLVLNPDKLFSLNEMEDTGGEPDVVLYSNGKYIFYDCSKETPVERRSLCYDDGKTTECVGLGYNIYNYERKSITAVQFSPFFTKMKN